MAASISKHVLTRPHELVAGFTRLVHAHVDDLATGRATEALEIRDFASQLCVHPTHLSTTIKQATGEPACAIFERKLVAVAQALLLDPSRTIADVAAQLTYDPSNFTKFFKHFTGCTPRQFRAEHQAASREQVGRGLGEN